MSQCQERLARRGSEIFGAGRRWQMTGVHGPLPAKEPGKEYFAIETSAQETLMVYRGLGERGMRELYLLSVELEKAG